MVGIVSRPCRHDDCTTIPSFNIEGHMGRAYGRQHARDGTAIVASPPCRNNSCTRTPSFNVQGKNRGAYCKRHADDGMIDVRNKRCSHISCTETPSCGSLARGVTTVCTEHKKDGVLDSPLIDFRPRCKIIGCPQKSACGIVGQQPSICGDHATVANSNALTVRPESKKSGVHQSQSRAAIFQPFKLKTECSF